ncbi:hypothetical protein ACFQI7_24020 [Paenibacillus allorhizosphaerae]|uniref:Uncharacterized protein n=1 Tax=Paenibacillus allorhizosphaerae TaxID=2849866 RepID=A0ABN7TSI9_9BACL|nr:hypothetical protein [Paenibacillus allorhizosphaerae]CAG7646672.1 hypothetical protein PAECIP111802_03803 [Paenibacillus allorhizosphaerae]
MELKDKGTVLKSYEALCYRIAYFLLQKEAAAVEAALLALKELLRDDAFFGCSEVAQRERVKAETIRQCLGLKREIAEAERGSALIKM